MHETTTTKTGGDVYCTVKQLCDRLAVGRTTVWRWQRERGFPAPKKLGGRTARYRVAEVDAWLARQG
jgi:hypothetical protein